MQNVTDKNIQLPTPQETSFINYIKQYGSATQEEIEKVLNIKKTRAYIVAKSLCDKGIIKVVGRGKDRKYYIA